MKLLRKPTRRSARAIAPVLPALLLLTGPTDAHASMFKGDTLDSIANGISWVVLIVAPIIGITVFWLVHILPEKIAEQKKHPQTGAIQCLCLLSLCFGGLLWPIAWLWAYTKPVLHKMAYGTDVDESHGQHGAAEDKGPNEVEQLRARIAVLEAQIKKGGA
jgi:CBS domain containing-hemolysin-like protein